MNKTTVILDSLKKLICYLSIMAIVVLIGTYAINYLIQKNLSEGEYWVCWKAERKSEFFNYYEPIFCERYYHDENDEFYFFKRINYEGNEEIYKRAKEGSMLLKTIK